MGMLDSPYFRDRELEKTVDQKGKVRCRYVYHGDWFERKLTENQRRAERYIEMLTALFAGGLAVLAAVQDTSANRGGFFGVLSMLALIPVLSVLVGAVVAFCKRGNLTRAEHHERVFLLRAMPLLAAALLLVLAVGYAIEGAWLALAAALGAGGLYAVMGVHELKVPYIIHPGTKPFAQ